MKKTLEKPKIDITVKTTEQNGNKKTNDVYIIYIYNIRTLHIFTRNSTQIQRCFSIDSLTPLPPLIVPHRIPSTHPPVKTTCTGTAPSRPVLNSIAESLDSPGVDGGGIRARIPKCIEPARLLYLHDAAAVAGDHRYRVATYLYNIIIGTYIQKISKRGCRGLMTYLPSLILSGVGGVGHNKLSPPRSTRRSARDYIAVPNQSQWRQPCADCVRARARARALPGPSGALTVDQYMDESSGLQYQSASFGSISNQKAWLLHSE